MAYGAIPEPGHVSRPINLPVVAVFSHSDFFGRVWNGSRGRVHVHPDVIHMRIRVDASNGSRVSELRDYLRNAGGGLISRQGCGFPSTRCGAIDAVGL